MPPRRNPIEKWRADYRLSQRKAAELLGCSRQALINWESGKHRLPTYIELAIKALRDGHARVV